MTTRRTLVESSADPYALAPDRPMGVHDWYGDPQTFPARSKSILVFTQTRERHSTWGTNRSDDEIAAMFHALAADWRADTSFESSLQQIITHYAYQRIIGLGPRAVPFILGEMQRQEDHWFWALSAIVGQDVAAGTETVEEATNAWLGWGRREGILDE